MKKIFWNIALLFCIFSQSINALAPYPLVLEKLIYFKHDNFKVFYGGPVDRDNKSVQWLMPISFENESHITRAVYEAAFINCSIDDAQDAEIVFVNVKEINIKFKNTLSSEYKLFSSLLNGEYKNGKYIVIRACDIAHTHYPDIFIFSESGQAKLSDKLTITDFFSTQLKTQNTYKDFDTNQVNETIALENENEKIFNPLSIAINFDGQNYPFFVTKIIKKNDPWKVYYLVSKNADFSINNKDNANHTFKIRMDSGCVSGQIYDDAACECLDQLHDALKKLALDESPYGIIIHIPTQDGRGFGTAPKAETEIYKRGGNGRIHSTVPLDTIKSAQLLYGTDNNYDLRSFDGAAQSLVSMNIKKVILITDNIEKINGLKKYGIDVLREKTDIKKASCQDHIDAKYNSTNYFSE